MSKDTLFALIVALVTWCGVWIYLFRMERQIKNLERSLRDVDVRDEL